MGLLAGFAPNGPDTALSLFCTLRVAQYVIDFMREPLATIFDESKVTFFEVRRAVGCILRCCCTPFPALLHRSRTAHSRAGAAQA